MKNSKANTQNNILIKLVLNWKLPIKDLILKILVPLGTSATLVWLLLKYMPKVNTIVRFLRILLNLIKEDTLCALMGILLLATVRTDLLFR